MKRVRTTKKKATPPAETAGSPAACALPFALPRASSEQRERASALFAALEQCYPDAHCELDFRSPHELLVAVILSAQATDVSVNKVTPGLFKKFPTPAAFAASSPTDIEPSIRSIGLFRNKAKAVHAAMTAIVEKFEGEVPRTMEELLTLRGVARKTANVVLSNCYDTHSGFVVDTHVERLSKRMGLVPRNANVARIERRLMALVPREKWGLSSHLLIFHGRRACKARGVTCAGHPICRAFGTRCELRPRGASAKDPVQL